MEKRRLLSVFSYLLFAMFLVGICLSEVRAQNMAPYRDYDPVVVPFAHFPQWLGVADIRSVNVYRFEGNNTFTPIPFQIDKRRKINLRWNTNAQAGTQKYTDVCEYGYFRELAPPPGVPDPFASDLFQTYDELVFVLADGGTLVAGPNDWVAGTTAERFQVTITDQTGQHRYVYVHAWPDIPPDLSTTDYVSYAQDVDPPPGQCEPVAASCGTITGSATGRLALLHSLNAHFAKNWVTDALEIKAVGGGILGDPLNRLQMSTGSENEDSWSSGGLPRFLGIKDGKVRVIRGIQGAQSGHTTTKYESGYPTALVTRINLRVHPLGELKFGVNHRSELATNPAQLYTKEVSGDNAVSFDLVNGVTPATLPPVEFTSWVELLTNTFGSYEHALFEHRAIPPADHGTSVRLFDYEDKLPYLFGRHGRKWVGLGNMQDGYLYDNDGNPIIDPDTGLPVGNDGGCPVDKDPESHEYLFARLEHVFMPQPGYTDPTVIGNSKGSFFGQNFRNPLTITALYETNGVPPPGWTPCARMSVARRRDTGLS